MKTLTARSEAMERGIPVTNGRWKRPVVDISTSRNVDKSKLVCVEEQGR